VSTPRWPDGHDPAARELAAALDHARARTADDMSLRRGWSAVADLPERRLPPRVRRWSYFAGGVASAALAVACAALLWPRTIGGPRPGAVASAPEAGVRRLTLEGGVEAKLSASGVLRFDGGDPRVEGGEVRFSVPHRAPGRPFIVRAESYWVVVVGTRFGVAVDGGRNVAIDVDEGVVEVWGRGQDGKGAARRLARLAPGEGWRSPPVAVEPPVVAPPPTPAADAAPAAGARPATASAEPVDKAPRHAARSSGHAFALASPGGGEIVHAVEAPPSESPPPTGDPTAIARAALASGDTTRALQLYRALAGKSGPAAENAAYEIGKILGDKLGQPAAAVAAWRRYRSEYPQGLLRIEADVSIIETLARSGETDDALAEAADFLRRHPDSERRGEIARVAGDLYRARGDCRRAVGAYQIAIGAARTRDVSEAAAFHRAECLVRLGDSGGPDAARAYLRSYPSGRFRSEATALVSEDGRSR
jgi:tetratricopeptide (TPR) repeat protein